MNMISLVEVAGLDKVCTLMMENKKEYKHFRYIFSYPLNILHKSNALKGKKPKFATTKSKI